MIFIHPDTSRQGIGNKLLGFAIDRGLRKVDVNEANIGALVFYQKLSFKVVRRDELDSEGRPYPILHLLL